MEKEIVWTTVARKDFWDIINYLSENWPDSVLENFSNALRVKTQLIQVQPKIGFKSSKYSRFRKTIITEHYILIYSIKKEHIVIHRLKHGKMK